MNVSRDDLYRLIVEEYAKEEGYDIEEGQSAEDLLKQILGDKYRPPEERDPARYAKHDGETAAMDKPHETSPDETLPIPADDAPESEYSGFQDRPGSDVEDQLSALIQGMEPEAVAELFQSVFAKIPGVEIGDAEEDPESLYSHGAEGRPVAGFQLEGLMELVREVIAEGDYHDMGDEDEMYNVLVPPGLENMSDAELIDMAKKDGIEEIPILDGNGDLSNREEIIVALKNV